MRTWLVFFGDSFNSIADIWIDDPFPQGLLAFVVLQHLLEVFWNSLSIWRKPFLEPYRELPRSLGLLWSQALTWLDPRSSTWLVLKHNWFIFCFIIIIFCFIIIDGQQASSSNSLFVVWTFFKMFELSQTVLLHFPLRTKSKSFSPLTTNVLTRYEGFSREEHLENESESSRPSTLWS